MPLIYTVSKGTFRYKEIEGTIKDIHTRMLVKELKNLKANEIIILKVCATVPPTVEYILILKEEKLLPSIRTLHQWGKEYAVEANKDEKNI